MLDELRQRLQALQKNTGIDDGPGVLPLGIAALDATLGGGLARGALHEVAAAGEAHLASATGFALGLAASAWHLLWIAEDMALAESGAPYGPGLDAFKLKPERLITAAVAHRRDLLWAMEEALHCRALGAVIGELRHGAIDPVAVRRLSLAATASGALALLLRAQPADDASTAATRWIVGAAPSGDDTAFGPGAPRFAAQLIRNRRGPLGSWILEWRDTDERFILATHPQPVAAPLLDRPRRKVA
ncbi:MAG: DNA repair protein [Pseudolabrys sp.]|nr:DNA repair protein [Pseudolabrys sp.]MDP2294495.1 DNA repair protein [Pseudolabrys sp.]